MKPTIPMAASGTNLRKRILAVTLSLVTAASMVPTSVLGEAAALSAQSTSSAAAAANASVNIYSTYLTTSESSTSGTYAYAASDTLWAWARERGASAPIDASTLTYQWQVSSDNSTWEDIPGATTQSLPLANYAGRYVRCALTTADGVPTHTTRILTALDAAC